MQGRTFKTLLIVCRDAAGHRTEAEIIQAAETGALIVENPNNRPMEELVRVVILESLEHPSAPAPVGELPPEIMTSDNFSQISYSPDRLREAMDDFHTAVGQSST